MSKLAAVPNNHLKVSGRSGALRECSGAIRDGSCNGEVFLPRTIRKRIVAPVMDEFLTFRHDYFEIPGTLAVAFECALDKRPGSRGGGANDCAPVPRITVEFTDLIACLFSFNSEGGAIHALNTSRKETYLRLGAINNLQ